MQGFLRWVMSRSGRIPITIPESTEVTMRDNCIFAKGKLGELKFEINELTKVDIKNNQINILPSNKTKKSLQMWGTVRSRIFNIVQGVTEGFSKNLILNGVGYKALMKGKILELNLGFSHPINFEIPEGIIIKVAKPTEINISGPDKQKVGQVAADIRSFRKPEPFKGKGIKYENEIIRRKEGKKK